MILRLAAATALALAAPTAAQEISAANLTETVRTLASDQFQGRAPGTIGEERTIGYLIGRVWTALRWQAVSGYDATCWLVQPCVRPVMRPCHAPLAMMPFARIGSRPIGRTRGAPAKMGFPDPAVSTGFVHQLLSALPNLGDAMIGA